MASPKKPKPRSRSRLVPLLLSQVYRYSTRVAYILCLLGVVFPILTPLLLKRSSIDENAMSPATATASGQLADAHAALARMRASSTLSTTSMRTTLLMFARDEIGVTASTQAFRTTNSSDDDDLANVAGVLRSRRADGRDAIALVAAYTDAPGQTKGSGAFAAAALQQALVVLSGERSRWLSRDVAFAFLDARAGAARAAAAWIDAYTGGAWVAAAVPTEPFIAPLPPPCRGGRVVVALAFESLSDTPDAVQVLVEGAHGAVPNADLPFTAQFVFGAMERMPVLAEGERSQHEGPLTAAVIRMIADALGPSAGTEAAAHWHAASTVQAATCRQALRGGVAAPLTEDASDATSSIWPCAMRLASRRACVGIAHATHAPLLAAGIDAITIRAIATRQGGRSAEDSADFMLHFGRSIESCTRSFSNLDERLHHATKVYGMIDSRRYIPTEAVYPPAALLAGALLMMSMGMLRLDKSDKDDTNNDDDDAVDDKPPTVTPHVGGWMANARVVVEAHFASLCVAFVPEYVHRLSATNAEERVALFAWISALIMALLWVLLRARQVASAWKHNAPVSARELPAWEALKVAVLAGGAATLGPLSALAPSVAALLAMPLVPIMLVARPVPFSVLIVIVAACCAAMARSPDVNVDTCAKVLWSHIESARGDPGRSLLWLAMHGCALPSYLLCSSLFITVL
ncbi:GPI-anchor transamidase subunit GAA1 [Pseudoscourfieldia marina]